MGAHPMSKNNIKNEIDDLKKQLQKDNSKHPRSTIFERIDLYTKTYESDSYKKFKEAVLSDPECDPTLYLKAVPYTKRELYEHLLDMELNYFPKIMSFVDNGNK